MADANVRYKVSQVGAEKVSGAFKKIAQSIGIAFAIREVAQFTVALKNAARDGVETRQKFDVVFSSLERGAGRVADAFSKEFKLAGATTRDLLGGVGDLLVGFGFNEKAALDMSVQVNRLAQDLASFSNFAGGAKGASDALTKALVGETESVKALGIVIRQTTPEFIRNVQVIQDTQGVTLLQAKAIEILRIAYEQSGKAIGDFERTQTSLANRERILDEQLKDLSETLGSELIPVFTEFTASTQEAVSAFADFNETLKILTGLGDATKGVGVITNLMDAFSNALGRMPQLERLFREELIKTNEELEKRRRIIGTGLGRQIQEGLLKAAHLSRIEFEGVSDEVDNVRKRLKQVKVLIDGQGLSFEKLNELLMERKTLEEQLKLPVEEVNKLLEARLSIVREVVAASEGGLVALGAGTRTPGVGGGILGRQGRPGATSIFGAGAQSAQMIKDAGKVGETIFDGWANVLTSNMNTAWAEIFGEANSLFEQLINSMVDLLIKDVFTGLLNFIAPGGGGILGFIGGLFSSPTPSPITQTITGSSRTPGNQTIILQMGDRTMGEWVLEGNRVIQERRLTL